MPIVYYNLVAFVDGATLVALPVCEPAVRTIAPPARKIPAYTPGIALRRLGQVLELPGDVACVIVAAVITETLTSHEVAAYFSSASAVSATSVKPSGSVGVVIEVLGFERPDLTAITAHGSPFTASKVHLERITRHMRL